MKSVFLNRLLLILVLGGISCPLAQSQSNESKHPKYGESNLPKISRAQINKNFAQITFVDALESKYFDRSRIKGSVNIPFDSTDKLASKLLPQKDAVVVVYCMNTKCHAADKVADDLARLGYKNISIYREGLQDWISAGLPTEGSDPNDPIPPIKSQL